MRIRSKNSRVSNKLKAVKARIEECNRERYQYRCSSCEGENSRWISVKDITAHALELQKKRTSTNKRPVLEKGVPKKKAFWKKLRKPMKSKDRVENLFGSSGFRLRLNPRGDGDCQFMSLTDQLQRIGITIDAQSLRAKAVSYLESHDYLGGGDNVRWDAFVENRTNYLSQMTVLGTYGDQLTLQAVSEIFNVQILIVSTLNKVTNIINPQGSQTISNEIPILLLGHIDEDHGIHYVSLTGDEGAIMHAVHNCYSPQIYFPCLDDEQPSVVGGTVTPINGTDSINSQVPDRITLNTGSKGNSGSSVKIAPKCVDLKEDSTAKLNCNPASAVDPCDLEETSEHTENAAVTETESEHMQAGPPVTQGGEDHTSLSKATELTPARRQEFFPDTGWEIVVLEAKKTYDLLSIQKLSCVNKMAFNMLKNYVKPTFYMRPDLVSSLGIDITFLKPVSVRNIWREAGKGSGIVSRLKELNIANIYNAYLVVMAMRHGWFKIIRVYHQAKK